MRPALDSVVHRSSSLTVFLAAALAACSSGEKRTGDTSATAATSDTTIPAKCAGDNAGLTLPAGICATVFADSIGHARHVVVAPNGDVYVTLEGTQPTPKNQPAAPPPTTPKASVVALRDTTRDGHADVIARVGTVGKLAEIGLVLEPRLRNLPIALARDAEPLLRAAPILVARIGGEACVDLDCALVALRD